MAAQSVLGGLARTKPEATGAPAHGTSSGVTTHEIHPGGQGSNIYHLMRVPTTTGPHLIGSVSKGSGIVDFTTGETIHDFSDLGPGPMLAPGSYAGEQALWYNPVAGKVMLYLGGWVKRPATSGTSNIHTNKYSWVAEFSIDGPAPEFVRYLVLDKAQAADSWQGEVTQIIPTDGRLIILRGDANQGSAPSIASLNSYSYYYTGTDAGTPVTVTVPAGTITIAAQVTLLEAQVAKKGGIYGDQLLIARGASTTVSTFALADGTWAASNFGYQSVARQGIGGSPAKDVHTVFRSAFAHLGGMLFHGTTNGYFLGDPRVNSNTDVKFMPMLICPNGGASIFRALGWRSRVLQAEGGLIVAANADTSSNRTDAVPSYLLWIGQGGTVRVLRQGGAFGGLEIHDGRLYYGVVNEPHTDIYSNYKHALPQLTSMPLEDIHTARPPAIVERISHTSYAATFSGEAGWLGGYPTLGYGKGHLWLTSSAAGTLTLSAWSVAKGGNSGAVKRDIGTATFTAGETKCIDLATLEGLTTTGGIGKALSGDVLGFIFSANTSLVGEISLAA